MTLDISAIRQRIEKATPGEWQHSHGDQPIGDTGDYSHHDSIKSGKLGIAYVDDGEDSCCADFDLIAHAPADLRALCDEVEAVRELLKRADAYVDCAPWLSEDIHRYFHGGDAPSVPTEQSPPNKEGK